MTINIRALLHAVCDVCKQMLDMDAEIGAASPGSASSSGDRVSIMVGFTGDYSGETYYIFPRNTALEIVKSMSGMEIDEIDEFVTSALGEISNIISGNAMTGLSELAIACAILPPKLVEQ
jgi:chemotaxis protein CheX